MSREIQLDMRITDILEAHPETSAVFAAHGLGSLTGEEALRVLGPFLTLETALRSRHVSPQGFLKLLHECVRPERTPALDAPGLLDVSGPSDLRLLALMPCGLKVPFARALTSFLETPARRGGPSITFAVEGNLNQELSYYTYVSHIENADELPDIIISSDFNAFFYEDFYRRFVEPGCFVDVTDYEPNGLFAQTGISDPARGHTILCINPLIIVADLEKVGDRPLPRRWKDILDPMWKASITLRGNEQFFCHAVLLPLFQEHGPDGMRALARNVLNGWHPAQMVEALAKGRHPAALYVMPDFFARKIPNRRPVELIWPEEGALASPVSLLVKRKSAEILKPITDYLTGEEMARVLAGAYFPTPRPDVPGSVPPNAGLKWLGWDYIRTNDLHRLNGEIDSVFLPAVNGDGGVK